MINNDNDITEISQRVGDDFARAVEGVMRSAGYPLDTGLGGFVIGDNVYSLTPKKNSDPDPEPDSASRKRGRINTFDNSSGDIDIPKNVKVSISDFMSRSTLGSNKFPLDPHEDEPEMVSTGRPDGRSTPPLVPPSNSSKFTRDNENTSGTTFIPPGREDDWVLPDSSFHSPGKLERSADQIDGNDLHSTNLGRQGLYDYTKVLLKNNRFGPGDSSSFVDSGGDIRRFDSPLSIPPSESYPDGFNISSKRMAQVGPALILRASNHTLSSRPIEDPSETEEVSQEGLFETSLKRVNPELMQAREALNQLLVDAPESQFVSTTPGGLWGVMNNQHIRFSGLDSSGTIVAAIGLFALVSGAAALFSLPSMILDTRVNPDNQESIDRQEPLKKPFGTSVSGQPRVRYTLISQIFTKQPTGETVFTTPEGFDWELLGITRTKNDFYESLLKGILLTLGTLDVKSAGFSITMFRSVLRSILRVIDEFNQVSRSENVLTGTKATLRALSALKESKLLSIINIFAQLGDISIRREKQLEEVKTPAEDKPHPLNIDEFLKGGDKNRPPLPTSSLGLLAANQRSMLLGNAIDAASSKGDPHQESINVLITNSLSTDSIDESSIKLNDPPVISPDALADVENQLNAEYMPFYFHDLRTNEIISFDAFLETLSDNYQVRYNDSIGFGRVDPIKTYESTTRDISFSFFIAPTSRQGFDDMWLKINKFMTLMYPQFTEGKKKSFNDTKFTQPFSQLFGAAPMIRLKIGDLIGSNYTDFRMNNLFGAVDPKGADATDQIKENELKKSFKSTMGKGLAGFINGTQISWIDAAVTWEVESGARAPKWCKFQCNFSPIHDISPGLDHKGKNRAPIYQIKRTAG